MAARGVPARACAVVSRCVALRDPHTTFSTAATSAWLRLTNAMQLRFFKIGAQVDF